VAQAAGVSKTVASRALAGYNDVAEATRDRVTMTARDLGYRASTRARALAAGKDAPARCGVAVLGMTSREFGQSFYGPVLTGIAAQAAVEGMDVHLVSVPGRPEDCREMLAHLVAEDRADGFILLTFFPLTPEDIRPLADAAMPFVLANRHLGNHPAYCVTPDWAGATQRAVERLTALGHRRLGLLLPDSSVSTVRDHEQGWCAAVAQYPVERAPVMHYREPDGAGGYHLALTTLREGLSAEGAALTALVCFNDYCAHGVLQAARELGVRVPDRLSLVSFDDVIAAYTTPPLCSFDPNLHEVGAAAVTLLRRALNGETPGPGRLTLPLPLRWRESCAPAPSTLRYQTAGD
jgi:LacI family transcriptional regulator